MLTQRCVISVIDKIQHGDQILLGVAECGRMSTAEEKPAVGAEQNQAS